MILAMVAAGAITLALVWGGPLGSILWVVLMLACPLMMMFLMHGHGDGVEHHHHDPGNDRYPRGVQ